MKTTQKTKIERIGRRKGVETVVSDDETQKFQQKNASKAAALAASMPTHQADMLDDDKIPY